MPADEASERLIGAELLSAVSAAMVDLHTDPDTPTAITARSYLNEDMLCCVLRDVLTNAERILVENGRGEQVLALRHAFERTMRDRFTDMVERLSGRPVEAFLSQNCLSPDIALETFFLAAEAA